MQAGSTVQFLCVSCVCVCVCACGGGGGVGGGGRGPSAPPPVSATGSPLHTVIACAHYFLEPPSRK